MASWLWGSIWLVKRKIDVCLVVSHVELKAVQVWWNSACWFPFHLSPFQCPSFPQHFCWACRCKGTVCSSVPGDQSLHLSLGAVSQPAAEDCRPPPICWFCHKRSSSRNHRIQMLCHSLKIYVEKQWLSSGQRSVQLMMSFFRLMARIPYVLWTTKADRTTTSVSSALINTGSRIPDFGISE